MLVAGYPANTSATVGAVMTMPALCVDTFLGQIHNGATSQSLASWRAYALVIPISQTQSLEEIYHYH